MIVGWRGFGRGYGDGGFGDVDGGRGGGGFGVSEGGRGGGETGSLRSSVGGTGSGSFGGGSSSPSAPEGGGDDVGGVSVDTTSLSPSSPSSFNSRRDAVSQLN